MSISFNEIRDRIVKFRDDREWLQFHTPKNLAEAIAVEAGELLEKFLWVDNKSEMTCLRNKK